MIPFMVSLRSLEERNPSQPGWPLRSIHTGSEALASTGIAPHRTESELETIVADAVQDGLLLKVPYHIGGPATLYKSTKDMHDLVLFVSGTAKFDNLVLAASQDPWLKDAYKITARMHTS
jgi:hypothetical protein